MYSALKIDAESVKEFGIDKDTDQDPELKLGFCRAQREEYMRVLWRERVELVIAKKQSESKDATVRLESDKNVLAHELGIQQFVRAIKVLNVFINELQATIPAE